MIKKILLTSLILAVLAIVFTTAVKANSSRVIANSSCTTSGTMATTSVVYMTPGTATTTLECDFLSVSGAGGGVSSMDSAVLAIQQNASTSASNLNFKLEYSQDGEDWFTYGAPLTSVATTTVYAETGSENTWSASAAGISRTMVPIPTPTRYVKVTFTVPIGTANLSLWSQIIGKAERIDR